MPAATSNGHREIPHDERRQFARRDGMSPAARELANAIDNYKLLHGRPFITCDEILSVLARLGYARRLNRSDGI
jgi:hypothetical protein